MKRFPWKKNIKQKDSKYYKKNVHRKTKKKIFKVLTKIYNSIF